jgi:hypothetical protein
VKSCQGPYKYGINVQNSETVSISVTGLIWWASVTSHVYTHSVCPQLSWHGLLRGTGINIVLSQHNRLVKEATRSNYMLTASAGMWDLFWAVHGTSPPTGLNKGEHFKAYNEESWQATWIVMTDHWSPEGLARTGHHWLTNPPPPTPIVPAVVSTRTAISIASVVNTTHSHNIYHVDIGDGDRDRLLEHQILSPYSHTASPKKTSCYRQHWSFQSHIFPLHKIFPKRYIIVIMQCQVKLATKIVEH